MKKRNWLILALVASFFIFSGSGYFICGKSLFNENEDIKTNIKAPDAKRVNIKFSKKTPRWLKQAFFDRLGLIVVEYDVFGYDITEWKNPDNAKDNLPHLFENTKIILQNASFKDAKIIDFENEKPQKRKPLAGCIKQVKNLYREKRIIPWFDQKNKQSIGITDAHNFIKEKKIPLKGNGVVIIDDGPEMSHPDIRPALRYNMRQPIYWINNKDRVKDFIGDHGTHVSCLAAGHRNFKGAEGVAAPNSYILPIVISYKSRWFYFASDIARGLKYFLALEKIGAIDWRVANMSLAMSWNSKVVYSAIRRLKSKIFVVAAGNESKDLDEKPKIYPAVWRLPNVIAVAAYREDGKLCRWSNYGRDSVDIAAPGNNVLSCVRGKSYKKFSGTSMASPLVAGTMSLLFSIDYDMSVRRAKNILFFGSGSSVHFTRKIINARRLNVNNAIRHAWFIRNY